MGRQPEEAAVDRGLLPREVRENFRESVDSIVEDIEVETLIRGVEIAFRCKETDHDRVETDNIL